jgi:glycosyltransferase involved in cell wall biosynthesis
MIISIITVTYNSAKTISDTLDSVFIQTYPSIEHILIDGASSDETLEIILNHRNLDIKLKSEPDNGIYDAMNKGLSISSGDIIGFLNSDDLYADTQVLTCAAKVFCENPNVEACYGDLLYVTQDNLRVTRLWKSSPFKSGSFARGWCPAHPTFFVRRSALIRLGFFDLNYRLAADTEFMMRYLEWGNILSVYIPRVLVRMRVGGATNKSWRNIVSQNQEIFRALKNNDLKFSPIFFIVCKLLNRLGQRFKGLLYKEML